MAASYDVFLSFRGEDTRKSFVCHLYKALEQKAIHTFIDSEKLEKGNKISELLNAVAESSVSVVVLSQNYAASTWCLKELVKIMECYDNDQKKQIVVPVFYEVDPSDIRKWKKMFGEELVKHEENPNLDREEVKRWKTALKRITDLSGWDSRQYKDDIELIEKIVGDILEKWIYIPQPSSLPDSLVGMDHHIKEVSLRLCRGKNDVGVVGIWGMGGLGKTTIARAVYDKIVHQFEHRCFLYNVKERFAKSKDEAKMRGELLFILLKGNVQIADIFNEGSNLILERLGTKKVLVVLDDVETFSQIGALLGKFYSFGVGSRILITTRDKESLAGVNETYEPRCLNHKESLELFMKHAFGTNQPSEEFSDLPKRAIDYAQGLPLALEVLGSSLYKKSIQEWNDLLEKIKKIPERKILDVLRTSFEGLDESEKDIFLDVACLFSECPLDFVTEVLQGFFPHIGLRNLVNRALLVISHGEVNMHDLLQEMGREIVRRESIKEPGKRSRLWSYEDVNRVLTQNTATDDVQCLMLDLSNSKVELRINTEAFVRMTKLRVLIIHYSHDSMFDFRSWFRWIRRIETICPVDGCRQVLMGDLEFLSDELRFLLWHGCPLKSLPSAFIPKNLVRIDMRGSRIQELWEGIKPLQNLKVIMLSHCRYLVKIPDLTEAIKLEKLYLDGCSSLFEVHSSIFDLQNLHFLNLMGCKELKSFPSSIRMKSLQTLALSGCSNLEQFPEIAEVMNELRYLPLDGTAIQELPSSINNLTGLDTLDLRGCREFKSLPSSIDMKSLGTLRLSGCSNVEKFPEISEYMTKLRCLDLNGTAIKELPSSINNLTGLVELNLKGCTELKSLPTRIHLSSLQTLNLEGCSSLESFPEITGIMKELPELVLDRTAIKGLPSSIDLLEGLKRLSMRNCKSLEFLPDSICNLADLTDLYLSGCSALHNLPENLGDLESLDTFDIHDSGIKQLPFSILRVRKLTYQALSCIRCKEMIAPLSAWPSSMDEYCCYSVLEHLDLSDCNLLELTDGIAHLSTLRTLKLCRNNMESLPVSMNRLRCLTHLELEACKRLKSIPELSPSINCIDAHDCTALDKVSKPRTPAFYFKHYSLQFSNCLQLVHTNLFRDIVETYPHLQDDHLPPLRLKMYLPGSEVPDWFDYQSGGFSVSVQLQPNWPGSNFLGFAICAIRTCHEINKKRDRLLAACSCTFKGDCGKFSFNVDLVDSDFEIDRLFTSDHMFLRYVSWSDFCPIEEGMLVKEAYTEAIFKIVVESKLETEQLRIGVRFVYANPDEMLNISMPQPRVHRDGCETAVGFMDLYGSRNKAVEILREMDSSESESESSSYGPCSFPGNYMEVQNESMAQPTTHVEALGTPFSPDQLDINLNETETGWEADSLESGGEKDTSQTPELLPPPQTEEEREEEDEIGLVCCCLSLSGCTMCLRRRVREKEENRDSGLTVGRY